MKKNNIVSTCKDIGIDLVWGIIKYCLLKSNLVPAPIIDTSPHLMKIKAILVANKLGVFEGLSGRSMTAEELATELNLNSRALGLLFRALTACGYVTENHGRFMNQKKAEIFLTKKSPRYLGNYLIFLEDAYDFYNYLEETIRIGCPPQSYVKMLLEREEVFERMTLAMLDLARMNNPFIFRMLKLPAYCKKVLDVGGSHGYTSISLCRKYPHLRATILDFNGAAKIAKELVRAYGMEDRIDFRVGDFMADEIGSEYDVVLFFNFIHLYPPEINQWIFKKAFQAIRRKGRVVILDFVLSQDMSNNEYGSLFGLTMLVMSPGGKGQTYSFEEIREWIMKAGFQRVWRQPLPGGVASLVHGEKRQ